VSTARLLAVFALLTVTRASALPPETRKLLDKAEAIELLSLEPKPLPAGKRKQSFHNYKVLGKVSLTKKADREKVLKALYKGIDDNKGLVAACFKPRHGILAEVGGKKIELVICYECLAMTVFVDGNFSRALTDRGPVKVFNKVLTDAKVPLPKQPN
jgi:hypothetical protein